MTPRTPPPPHRPGASPRQRSGAPWWLWFAIGALLAVQAIGQAHRIAHRDLHAPRAPAISAVHAALAGSGLSAWPSRASATEPAFGHDEGSLECRLYDQLTQADLASATDHATVCDPALALIANPAQVGQRGQAQPAPQARGPPAA